MSIKKQIIATLLHQNRPDLANVFAKVSLSKRIVKARRAVDPKIKTLVDEFGGVLNKYVGSKTAVFVFFDDKKAADFAKALKKIPDISNIHVVKDSVSFDGGIVSAAKSGFKKATKKDQMLLAGTLHGKLISSELHSLTFYWSLKDKANAEKFAKKVGDTFGERVYAVKEAWDDFKEADKEPPYPPGYTVSVEYGTY